MDELAPAREIIVEAISKLEHGIEDKMTGQAPRSSKADIVEAADSLGKLSEAIRGHKERIDGALKQA